MKVLSLALLLILVSASLGIRDWTRRQWGTNIHFLEGRPGEMEQLAKAFSIARMDFGWQDIERVKGQYNWKQYDDLLHSLKTANPPVSPYWILDYGNTLYEGGLSPSTPEAIQAFVKFAVASIEHFKGNDIIWEMWNEPDGNFWHPRANHTAYSILAKAVGSAIKNNPAIRSETYVGPAVSWMNFGWFESVFQLGVLEYFDAVSVHPYRSGPPETVIPDYLTLRALIDKYAPKSKGTLPILSGEWGYSTCVAPCSPNVNYVITQDTQAKFLARQWLVNARSGVPITIFYDFLNDGPDPKVREQNFGTVEHAYLNATVPHLPKPSYKAALALQNFFGELPFQAVVQSASHDSSIYIYAFGPADNTDYALWKASGPSTGVCDLTQKISCGDGTQQECVSRGCCYDSSSTVVGPKCYFHLENTSAVAKFKPARTGCFHEIDIYGQMVTAKVCTDSSGDVSINVNDAPRYLLRIQ